MVRKKGVFFLFLSGFCLVLFFLPSRWVERGRVFFGVSSKMFDSTSYHAQTPLREDHLEALSSLSFDVCSLLARKKMVKELEALQEKYPEQASFFARRIEEGEKLHALHSASVVAPVVYRSHSAWMRSFWVAFGQQDARYPQIGLGSPVLYGPYLIGIVEFVGEKYSRVRLLTDERVVVAVRVLRKPDRDWELFVALEMVKRQLEWKKEMQMPRLEEEKRLEESLLQVQKALHSRGVALYLAKGELHGSSGNGWRRSSLLLKGRGFNDAFPGEEGRARRVSIEGEKREIPLVAKGDLLVTSGLDGLFPKGIPVATVFSVDPVNPADAWQSLQARLCIESICDFSVVTLLPSLQFTEQEEDGIEIQ